MKVSSRPGKLRRGAVLAAAATACATLLSSCGSGAPGVAAEVDGDRIPAAQVDDLARVLCALDDTIQALPGTEAGTPTRAARVLALQVLMVDQLAADVADVDAVDQRLLAQAQADWNTLRDSVPADLRDTFDEVMVEEYLTAQQALTELGRQSLVEQGQNPAEIDARAAGAEGARLAQEHATSVEIDVDPRYGQVVDGVLQASGGSLSVPVSDLAVQAAEDTPSESLVSALPATQKCG